MKKKSFRAKKDPWLTLFFTVILAMSFLPLISKLYEKEYESIVFACIFAGVFIIFAFLFFNIRYEFYDTFLYVKFGPVFEKLYYANINGVKYESGFFGDKNTTRLRIYYLGVPKNIVFPKDPDGFINELKKKCPDMIIERQL